MEALLKKQQIYNLNWEQQKFGLKTGRINLEREMTEEEEIDLIDRIKDYELLVINNSGNNSKNNLFIGKLNNCFVADINIQFEKEVRNFKQPLNKNIKIENNKEIDNDLIKIAKKNFIYSRFTNDSNIDKEKGKEVYVDWTKSSFNKKEKFFSTYKKDNKSVGYVLFSINDKSAVIELLAVDKEYQRIGISQAMINELNRYLFNEKKEVRFIKVGTQAENETAIKFYQNSGFKVVKINTVYHKWKKEIEGIRK